MGSKAVLLVRCVSHAVDFRSRRFRLVPLNCASRVIEVSRKPNHAMYPGHSMMVDILGSHEYAPRTLLTHLEMKI